VCHFQIQGMDYSNLPVNIPTVSDTPWAVGGSHRYDYSSAQRICVMISGQDCIGPFEVDYSSCAVRCWGSEYSSDPPVLTVYEDAQYNVPQIESQTLSHTQIYPGPYSNHEAPSVYPDAEIQYNLYYGTRDLSWNYPKDASRQGSVSTITGGNGAGFQDGAVETAMFDRPQGIASDRNGNIYIADSNNHRIRVITSNRTWVQTVAGDGVKGNSDGVGSSSRFNHPRGIALYYDDQDELVLVVADTDNHRIRTLCSLLLTHTRSLTLTHRYHTRRFYG
jgi:hypothetical protein